MVDSGTDGVGGGPVPRWCPKSSGEIARCFPLRLIPLVSNCGSGASSGRSRRSNSVSRRLLSLPNTLACPPAGLLLDSRQHKMLVLSPFLISHL